MGFAPVASVAILLVAGLASFAGYQGHAEAAADEVHKATRDAERRAADERQTSLSLTSLSYNNGLDRLTITVENTGATVIPTSSIHVLADGVLRSVQSVQVEGASAAYWPPLTTAQIVASDVPSSPTRVVVVAHNGIAVYGGP